MQQTQATPSASNTRNRGFASMNSERQREILQMLADGMQTEAVAIKLGLSTETVRTHTKRILAKLAADTRTQAVAIGIRTGLIE